MQIHPTIRLLSLLVVLVMLPLLSWQAVLIIVVVTVGLYALHPALTFKRLILANYRLRWLFLSILLLYFWFTPGDPVLGLQAVFVPTVQGVTQGLERLLIMLVMVSMVYATLWTTSTPDLQSAILEVLRLFHFPISFSHTLARRLTACLEAVPYMIDELSDLKNNDPQDGSRRQTIFLQVVRIFERAESLQLISHDSGASKSTCAIVAVSRVQFMVPVMLFSLMLILATISG